MKHLIKKGIILDVNVWGNIATMDMRYAKLMVEKIGKGFGLSDYRETVQYLVDKGCINSKDIWLKEIFKPEFCRALIIKVKELITTQQ